MLARERDNLGAVVTLSRRNFSKTADQGRPALRSGVTIRQVEGIGEAIRTAGCWEPMPKIRYPNFVMAVLEKGAARVFCRGATRILRSGMLLLCHPGEILASEPVARAGFTIRVSLCSPPSVLQEVADEIAGRRTTTPCFRDFLKPDPYLARLLLRFQATMEAPASRLESSSRLQAMLSQIILRRGYPAPTYRQVKPERLAVRQVRDYLHDKYADDVTLDELAGLVNLSPFHLNRVFRMEIGLPPHAYQTQVRVMRSKSLLARGMAIDEVAVEVGFFDQSHFTNHFKRHFGYTPGVYQAAIYRGGRNEPAEHRSTLSAIEAFSVCS
jgi:AraC-like DNA-binding protein